MLSGLEQALRLVRFAEPKIPLIANLTGTLADRHEITTPQYWVRHTREVVQFHDGMLKARAMGIVDFLEIGPHPVLVAMAQEGMDEPGLGWHVSLRRDHSNSDTIHQTIGSLYTRGHAIRWEEYDAAALQSRAWVKLPTYPFQRKSFWATRAAKMQGYANQSYSLLGLRCESGLHAGETTFTCSLGLDSFPYFRGHLVYDQVIVPAAAYMEMAIEAIQSVKGEGDLELKGLVIERPLRLVEHDAHKIQLVLTENRERNTYSFQIFSSPMDNSDEWQRHAVGEAAQRDTETLMFRPPLLAEIRERCSEPVPVASVYDEFAASGLAYGEEFQGLRQLFRGELEALGEVVIPDDLSLDGYLFHPALLDATFHTIRGVGPVAAPADGTAFLPYEVQHVRILLEGKPSRRVFVHARAVGPQDGKSRSFNITLYGELETPILEIEGFQVVKADRDDLLRRLGGRQT
jgi:myxalamid-type polyketide synthase MxaB